MHFLFPATCILCGSLSKRKLDLCSACEGDLPFIKNDDLLTRRLTRTQIITLFHYCPPIDSLLLGLKFSNRLLNANVLGRLLANYLDTYYQKHAKPEVIIPVPLHRLRLRERGYNQALELAHPIARRLKIKIARLKARRVKNTLAQAQLPAIQREQNISQAFQLTTKLAYKHLAVIDDVITTGSTVNELCQLFYQEGAAKIDIWCCAQAHPS